MDRETAIKRLQAAQLDDEAESAHGEADEVLCDLLEALGYNDVVEAYHKVQPKYYA